MSRQPRFVLPGYPQLLVQRGNNHQVVFKSDQDYLFYLNCLLTNARKYNCLIHAYILMENHVHILLTPTINHGISLMMQSLGKSYVRHFNQTYNRTGTLWEGRYKATLIDAESYLLHCQQYIECNAVRSNIAQTPTQYPWSSYHHNALGENNGMITTHALYEALGEAPFQRQEKYSSRLSTDLECDCLQNIRNAVHKQWVLGNTDYQNSIQRIISRQVAPKARGGDHKSDTFYRSNPKVVSAV